ncbi:hypothetical protein [Noviherbaspirillum sedimenti]|uniref:Uncharacterized protein n=1 Tax=Noviherbaspirillum sedimenti TaxID=2320865 RepID=A0A3A3G0N4_9BURK|nr:hypothetical protein [Noviherbaspirillum sedimenti]RJG02028.1 hypothetical protein D3878_10930 [Noviherbaspirillum sedimenti]
MANSSRTRSSFWLVKMAALCLWTCSLNGYGQAVAPWPDQPGAGTVAFDAMSTTVGVDGVTRSRTAEDMDGADNAITAALADGLTTGVALTAGGAIEMNPLLSSPLGLVAMTGLKIGLIKFAETLPEEEKRTAMKAGSAVWGGAAVNNLMVLFAAPGPWSIFAGIMMGIATWMHMDGQYQEQDRLAALRAAAVAQAAGAPARADAVEAGQGGAGIMTAGAEVSLSAGE